MAHCLWRRSANLVGTAFMEANMESMRRALHTLLTGIASNRTTTKGNQQPPQEMGLQLQKGKFLQHERGWQCVIWFLRLSMLVYPLNARLLPIRYNRSHVAWNERKETNSYHKSLHYSSRMLSCCTPEGTKRWVFCLLKESVSVYPQNARLLSISHNSSHIAKNERKETNNYNRSVPYSTGKLRHCSIWKGLGNEFSVCLENVCWLLLKSTTCTLVQQSPFWQLKLCSAIS